MGWHRDHEPQFGECGETKLIVSVSFGARALFKWKGKSCPDSDASWCWLGHGDVLVMDGQCQDEFLRCTDSGLEQERINVTFRWIRQHVALACYLPTCAQGSSVAVTEFVERGVFLGGFWVLFGVLGVWEVLALLVSPCISTGSVGALSS